jgi:acyl-homoserine lactone acylase PvdQ
MEDVKKASPPRDWQFDEEPVKNDIPINPVSDDAGASNSWVVHGDFTETGFPMLANDPHLGTALPAFWQL